MQHPPFVYAVDTYAETPLAELHRGWMGWLRGRVPAYSQETIKKYDDTFWRFYHSLRDHGEPLVMASLTPENVEIWLGDQQAAGLSEHTIIHRLGALKALTGKYLYRTRGWTHVDLLGRVPKSLPPDKPREGLTDQEREAVLGCFNAPTFMDRRDRAFVVVAMATGLRFREVFDLTLSQFDHRDGELVITGKGGKVRTARLGDRALKLIRPYLAVRPRVESDRLWLSESGRPLSYHGGHYIIRRARSKSGVTRLHWHLLRHGFAQHALVAGADPMIVQEMLGHSTATMTRKYLGYVKQQEAARQMPQYAPV
jgi:site-specific recombinase XerD